VSQLDILIARLEDIRSKYGDDAYKQAATSVASQFVAQGGEMEKAAREAFKDVVDFNALDAQKAQMPVDNPILAAIQQQVPGIKSQAQFNVFMAAFDALRLTMDAIFTDNPGGYDDGRKALEAAFEAARKATQITMKLADSPEAATSKAAAEFKTPPRQFTEASEQKALLEELATFTDLDSLNKWYAESRERIERVVSQSLRNQLFDAIRLKKDNLS
jgi:hypothetical protein